MRREEKHILASAIPGLIWVLLMWLVKGAEYYWDVSLAGWGMYPRSIEGLWGIITMPWLHADVKHLFSNSLPLWVLTTFIIYFYPKVALPVMAYLYLTVGIWTWCLGREAYHIGASGLVYAYASFLFFSGLFRKQRHEMAVALVVSLFYGGMVWGILPLWQSMSWEGHLAGLLAGIMYAWYYRKINLPPKPKRLPDPPSDLIYMEGEYLTMDQILEAERAWQEKHNPVPPAPVSRSLLLFRQGTFSSGGHWQYNYKSASAGEHKQKSST